jgi:type IV pilus assembly protein PilB
MTREHRADSNRSRPIGELLVSLGYLKQDQLIRALQAQRERPAERRSPVGILLVEMGMLSRERLDLILDRYGKRLRLGELLLHRNRITAQQLEEALDRQRGLGTRLGQILIEMGLIDEPILAEALAEQHDLAYIPLAGLEPQSGLIRYINAVYATRHGVVPIGKLGKRLTVAISDPTCREIPRDLERSTGLKVHVVLSTPSEVAAFARQLYDFRSGQNEIAIPGEAKKPEPPSTYARLLERVITRAAGLKATDIHLEPGEAGGRVRVRVGGALQELTEIESVAGRIPELVRSLKTMGHLDVADTRRPQEGSLVFQTNEGDFSRTLPLHISTMPSPSGEEAAIRLLEPLRTGSTLAEAGLSEPIRARFEAILRHAKGIALIVGPPGSGKRSTLRATLSALRREDAKIFTVEDPIIFIHPGVSQTQCDPGIGNTCAFFLRRFLRQSPDAVLLDEFVERDAAELAFGAGTSGPLILATLRANNSTDSVTRLTDLGVDPNMVASSLSAVLGQRLVRRNCQACSQPYEPKSTVLDQWFRGAPPSGTRMLRGKGCESCNGTGFAGRLVAAELWVPSSEEEVWISERIEPRLLRERTLRRIRCLGQDALEQAMEGKTTFEEALKVVPHEDVVFTRLHGLEAEKDKDRDQDKDHDMDRSGRPAAGETEQAA